VLHENTRHTASNASSPKVNQSLTLPRMPARRVDCEVWPEGLTAMDSIVANNANLLRTTYNRPIGPPFLGFLSLLAALLGLWAGVARRG
jgi:hypothetical protein